MGFITLTARQRELLRFLLEENKWLKCRQIADHLMVTDRTIRTDIKSINHLLASTQIQILSSKQTGYRIKYENINTLNQILGRKDSIPNSPQNRLRHVTIHVLKSDVNYPLHMETFIESLSVSQTTFEKTLQKSRDIIEHMDRPLVVQRKSKLLWTEGDEDTRRFLLWQLILDFSEHGYLESNHYYDYFGETLVRSVIECLLEAFSHLSIQMTDLNTISLVVYLCIKVMRLRQGAYLQSSLLPESLSHEQIPLRDMLAQQLQERFNVEFNAHELRDLQHQIVLCCPVKASVVQESDGSSIPDKYQKLVDQLLSDLYERYSIDLTGEDEWKNKLSQHLFGVVMGKVHVNRGDNIFNTMIRNEYPHSFEMAIYLYERLCDMLSVKLESNEQGYIAAYLHTAIEQVESKKQSRFSIAVVSNTTGAVSGLVMMKLKTTFEDRYEVIGPFSVYQIDEIIDRKPAVIVSTEAFSLPENCSIPVKRISALPQHEEFIEIGRILERTRSNLLFPVLPKTLRSYFSDELFFSNLQVRSKQEVIEFLSAQLFQQGYVDSDFCSQTLRREEMGPTNLGQFVAVPHAMNATVHQSIIAVASLRDPVVWDSGRVEIVFLMAIQKTDMKYLKRFFDITINLVDNPALVNRLKKAPTLDIFLHYLCKEDT